MTTVSDYDITWTTPSATVGEAMPIGNGTIAAMVWAESDGDLRLRMALCDSWDENARSIGLSNFRVALSPNPFAAGQPFRQVLNYLEGRTVVSAGDAEVTLTVWVDAHRPVIHVELASASGHSVTVSSERWRTETQTLSHTPWTDFIHVANFDDTTDLDVKITADKVVDVDDRILFYHRNETSVWAATAATQSVPLDETDDPYLHRTTGVVVQGSGMVSAGSETLVSSTPHKAMRIDLVAATSIAADVEEWKRDLLDVATGIWGSNLGVLRTAHEAHWADFWARSYLFVTGDQEAEQVTRGWIAARYLMALQGRAEGAIEFNGGAFTLHDDAKQWHDYTLFNEQFAYWSMLASGDVDLMQPFFDVAVGAMPVARAKSRAMWGHAGMVLPEHMIHGGFQSGSHYGWNRSGRDPDFLEDPYTRRLYVATPEIAVMMLDRYSYVPDAGFATRTLLPFAREVVTWYDLHWTRVNGKLNLQPIYSGEMDRDLKNPAAEIAALLRLLSGLLALPKSLTTAQERARWSELLDELPALPIADGQIRTSEDLALGEDTNNQNLYPIFPFKLYGKGQPDEQLAIDTYLNRRGKSPESSADAWRHDATHAAYLGLTTEAREQTVRAFTRYKYRYEGFLDGAPDGDHSIEPLAIGKIALQAMLLHAVGDRIQLFTAWPAHWNVRFRLWAPQNTTVEGSYLDGDLTALTVTPSSRADDLVIGEPE